MSTTMAQVRQAQPDWFSRKNKRFFGDVEYRVYTNRRTRQSFLIRATYAWSDMFGQPKRLTWRVNPLKEDLSILPLVDKTFTDLDDAKDFVHAQTEVLSAQTSSPVVSTPGVADPA